MGKCKESIFYYRVNIRFDGETWCKLSCARDCDVWLIADLKTYIFSFWSMKNVNHLQHDDSSTLNFDYLVVQWIFVDPRWK